MSRNKTNKTIAGYHLLMILSAIDFTFSPSEDKVIRAYLEQEFPFRVNLDKEMELISALRPDEWEQHFRIYMNDFYDDATKEELFDFFNFALQLINADQIITHTENHYIKLLHRKWFKSDIHESPQETK